MEPQMLLDSAKKAITPVTAGTFAMVSLCVVGVELVMWAIYRHHSVLPLVFLGVSRIIEGALMLGAAFAGQDRPMDFRHFRRDHICRYGKGTAMGSRFRDGSSGGLCGPVYLGD